MMKTNLLLIIALLLVFFNVSAQNDTHFGLKGAMIHGLSGGRMVDEEFFWPIFSQAEKLNVPIYLHPALSNLFISTLIAFAKSSPNSLLEV